MNILALSVGTRVKIIEYFKENLQGIGRIVACDASEVAPALYFADNYYIVPRFDSPNYWNQVMDICQREKIDAIFSLIDPELSILSARSMELEKKGIRLIGSKIEQVSLAFDKMKMYHFCKENKIDTIQSFDSMTDFEAARNNKVIDFPVFVKPICGSASILATKVHTMQTLKDVFEQNENLMIQEFVEGVEIGCDVYVDSISGEVINIFCKKKLLMRAGETDKAISFKDESLYKFVETFVKAARFSYNIDIDLFVKNGKYLISEVNPRFGGGYPHAYESGCNFIKYIINNHKGVANVPEVGNYKANTTMMKYSELKII